MSNYLPFLLLLLSSLMRPCLAQNRALQPKFALKTGILQYNQQAFTGNDTLNHASFRLTFANFGAEVLKEQNDELTLQTLGRAYQKCYREGFLYLINDPQGCVTKQRIKATDLSTGIDAFIKMAQDLIHQKINKSTDKAFISFVQTGTEIYLGRTCSKYEYLLSNFTLSSKDKMEFLVYKDICLSYKYYLGGALLASTRAVSFEENIPIPEKTFDLPSNLRIIDGEKLAHSTDEATAKFSSLIVTYTTQKAYGQMTEEGNKRLYLQEGGIRSAEDWEGKISEFNLPAESRHFRKIRDQDTETLVNYTNKTWRNRRLVKGNFNDKSAPELNYFLVNGLYDTSVKSLGQNTILGKTCHIFEVTTGIEKLEICEWEGVILKVKRFLCTDGADCKEFKLIGEEVATALQENPVIPASAFEIPEEFRSID